MSKAKKKRKHLVRNGSLDPATKRGEWARKPFMFVQRNKKKELLMRRKCGGDIE